MTKTDTVSPKKKGNRYLPSPPKLPEDKREEYIAILRTHKGLITPAAREFGCSRRTVYRAMEKDPHFKAAVAKVRQDADGKELDKLETVSRNEALDPKNRSERFFRMKALAPERYRERAIPYQATQVNVTVSGVAIKDRAKIIEEIERNRIDESEIQGWREEDTSQK